MSASSSVLLNCSAAAPRALPRVTPPSAARPQVRVFLLSHRVGAAGLTLVRASRVFLLEPALDPSIEQQAVARVHRIGQQRWGLG